MFEPVSYARLEALERRLTDTARWTNKLHYRQLSLVRHLEIALVDRTDGTRSMTEWVASRLDVTMQLASELLYVARNIGRLPELDDKLREGEITLQRAAATLRLREAAIEEDREALLRASQDRDLAGVQRMTAACRRLTPRDEAEIHASRYFSMQPTLDQSGDRITGFLPGPEAALVHRALAARADTFPSRHVARVSLRQRMADALVAISHDALDGTLSDAAPATPEITVFVDADTAASTRGERGAAVAAGARVGPATLDQILCVGTIGVVSIREGKPVSATPRTRSIPPAIRDFILARDGGCTLDGCTSRYRLQPHHIRRHTDGGDHDPENLTTLCWYHHHVEVHRIGRVLDPESPPLRRRFLPGRGHDTRGDPPCWCGRHHAAVERSAVRQPQHHFSNNLN